MEKQTKIAMITMFKNESSVILRMLESCYKYIDYYVMQDNGSTDGTQELVKEFQCNGQFDQRVSQIEREASCGPPHEGKNDLILYFIN